MKHSDKLLLLIFLVLTLSANSLAGHEWALYLYGLNGSDPTVAQMALYDWLRLRRSKPTEDIAVLGLRDLPFSDTRYYEVTEDGHSVVERRPTNENTGDPDNLFNFLTWASDRAPAKKTWLLFDGHGTGAVVGGEPALPEDRDFIEGGPGYEGLVGPEPPSGGGLGPGGIERDLLTMGELDAVLKRIEGLEQVELMAFQACQMQNLEALYEIRDRARYFVGSEESMRNHPFPLTDLVRYLSEHPEADGATFGGYFVEHCFMSTSHRILTLSCVEAAKLEAVGQSVSLLGEKLVSLPLWSLSQWKDENIDELKELVACGSAAVEVGSGKYVDLALLAKALKQWATKHSESDVATAANAVQNAVAEAVIITKSRKRYVGCGGLSIFFPKIETPGFISRLRGRPAYEPSPLIGQYDRTVFAQDTSWDDFVKVLARAAWERL